MKPLLTFYLILFFGCAYAQDTLYLPVPGLGHEKFVLNENGTFIYSSHLCGDSFYSFGSYKRSITGYKFKCDTTRCPKPDIIEKTLNVNSDSITLRFYNVIDSLPLAYIGTIAIGNGRYSMDSHSICLPKPQVKTNTLTINDYGNSKIFTFDSTCSELRVYVEPYGLGFRCGVNDIRKLKKTKYGYLNKFHVFDEIREKPWKKGTKRVVRHYYQLRR